MSVPSFTSFPTFETGTSKEPKEDDRAHRQERKYEKRHKSGSPSRRKDSERRRHEDSSRERRKDKERDSHKRKDRRREKGRDGRKYDEERHSSKGRTDEQPTTLPDNSHRLFFSDRKPDRLNIQYGKLHAGDVPRYHPIYGGRYAIGLPRGFILHRVGDGIEVCVRLGKSKLSSITDSRTRSMLSLPPTRRIVGTQNDSCYPEVDGCIRLPADQAKTASEDTYRSIIEVRDDEGSSSESTSAESDEEVTNDQVGKFLETSQQAQLRVLEQRLAQNPSSVDTWLALLDVTLSTIPITSKNATKARCDIAVSLLQRAIDSHPISRASPILHIKYLKAGEEIWDAGQLLDKWDKALRLGDISLWMEWLEWRIRQGKSGLEGLFEDTDRVLSAEPFQRDSIDSELARLRVFWRTVTAYKSAGFTERAMGMFQAQLEFTFNIPPQVASSPFHHQLDELEEFWDSETLRILEDGAKGWNVWYQNGKPDPQRNGPSPFPNPDVQDLDPYRQWAFHEAAVDRTAMFPIRAQGMDDADPYSTVLFSDIRAALVKISSPQAKRALRLAMLSFLGFPIPGMASVFSTNSRDTNWDDRWSMSAFTNASQLSSLFPKDVEHRGPTGESIAGTVIAHEKEYRDSFGPVKHWGYGTISPLDIQYGSRSRQHLWAASDIGGVDAKLALRVFSQLRQQDNDFEWDSLALAYESSLNIKNSLKLSKAFLATSKKSPEYWGAHAQLERLNGRLDGARKVYQTVLVASQPDDHSAQGLASLWWNWAEMEWLAGTDETSLNVVLRSVGVQSTTGVSILRAKRLLDEMAAAASHWQDRQNWTKLRALLELLNGADVKDALAVFDAQMTSLGHGTVPHESLTMATLLFLFNHRVVLKNPMPPAILRERAELALEAYPSNSIIMGVFLEGEKGQGVWGKVRGMLGASDGKVKDVARRMEEVWIAGWEKGRWKAEEERTRSGLSAAVEHERTRGSPIIWRLYLEFEIKVGKYHNAKKLLFRAIGECPMAKELYLLAFGPLRSVFDGQELQSLADLMAERGIRLRQALDEVVDMVEEKNRTVEDNGEEAMDEIEHNAQELRRLMPY